MSGNRVPWHFLLEIAFLAIWIGSVYFAWAVWSGDPTDIISERQLGATVILAELGAVITGSSIMLAGVGAFARVGSDQTAPRPVTDLRFAASWAIAAITVSLYCMATLPSLISTQNPVKSDKISLMAAFALSLVLLAAIRFLKAIYKATKS